MATYKLFGELAAPTVGNSETIGVSLATEVVCQPGWLVGYEFVRPSTATVGPFTAAFYDVATGTADPATVVNNINPTGVGRIQVLLPAPVYYASEIRARPTIHHPSGRYAFLNNAFAVDGIYPSGATSGPLFAPPSNATPNGNGLYVAGSTIAMPVNMFDETLYYISPIWSDVDPVGREGTGSTSATAVLATAGAKSATGTSSLSGTAALTPVGAKNGLGTAGLGATALLTVTGTAQREGVGALAAAAQLGSTGQAHRSGTGAITAAATLAAAGHNPDDTVTAPQFTVGPPRTRWAVGAPWTG